MLGTTMTYIRVKLIHLNPGEPVLLLSELDDERYEVRKLEIFRDGRVGRASPGEHDNGTEPGIEPVPSIASEFDGEEIAQSEFEAAWAALAPKR